MRALRFHSFGPPEVLAKEKLLAIEEVPKPEPGPGEVLVQVKAAGINPADLKNVAGQFHDTTLPRIPGRDFSGIVVAGNRLVGEEVWGSAPGFGISRDGVQAEFAAVPADAVARKPHGLTLPQAAAIGVPFVTAWSALMRAAELEAGETILIVGAAGAVGHAATQIAVWKGARVLGADRGSRPIPGASAVVDTTAEDLPARVFALTEGKGADAVFDTVGGPMFEPALRSLAQRGRQVAITSAGDPRVSFNLVDFYHRELRLIGVDSNRLTAHDLGEIAGQLGPGFESGALTVPEIEQVPFENAVDAYKKLASSGRKFVLVF